MSYSAQTFHPFYLGRNADMLIGALSKGRVHYRTQLVSILNAMTKETDQPGVPKG